MAQRTSLPVSVFWIVLFFNSTLFALQNISNDSLYTLARTEAYAGRYKEALLTIERILLRDPLYSKARILEGNIYLWRNDYTKAQVTLGSVLDQTPEVREAWIALIYAYYRGGSAAKACSTSREAQKQIGLSSVLQMQQKTVCQQCTTAAPASDTTAPPAVPQRKVCRFSAPKDSFAVFTLGARGSFFGETYGRYTWGYFTTGVNFNFERWGVHTELHMQRRKEGALNLYGSEIDVAPRIVILPPLTAVLRVTYSPYVLLDQTYPSKSGSLELYADFPHAVRLEGSARLNWYADIFSPTYSVGIGKRLWNYYLSSNCRFYNYRNRALASGSFGFRSFSKKRKRNDLQLALHFGKSTYDEDKIITARYVKRYVPKAKDRTLWIIGGYRSYVEGEGVLSIGFGEHLLVQPMVACGGERMIIEKVSAMGGKELVQTPMFLKVSAGLTVKVIKKPHGKK